MAHISVSPSSSDRFEADGVSAVDFSLSSDRFNMEGDRVGGVWLDDGVLLSIERSIIALSVQYPVHGRLAGTVLRVYRRRLCDFWRRVGNGLFMMACTRVTGWLISYLTGLLRTGRPRVLTLRPTHG